MMVSGKRLINADRAELYDAIGRNAFVDRQDIIDLINNQPTVDAVEVVRCRDCIGRSTWYNDAEYGYAVCGMSGMYPKSEDSYCSYGIRKDGDRNG